MRRMLVLCSSAFVSAFSERYAEEELGQDCTLLRFENCDQLRRALAETPEALCMLELSVLLEQCGTERAAELLAGLRGRHVTVLGGTEAFSTLPREAIRAVSTFFNMDAPRNDDAPRYPAAQTESEQDARCRRMLTQLAQGMRYGMVEMETLSSLLGLREANRCLFAFCIDLTGSERQALPDAAALEQLCYAAGLERVFVVPRSTFTWSGAAVVQARGYARRGAAVNAFCSGVYAALRRREPALCVTIGTSRLADGCAQLELQLEQAAAAAFERVYDGANRIYHNSAAKRGPARPFDKQPLMQVLHDAIDRRSPAEVRESLKALFAEVTACRLPERELQGVLMEIMSMMYLLCVQENLNIAEFNEDRRKDIDFLFLQSIVSVRQEMESFVEHFDRILRRAAEKREQLTAYSARTRRVISHLMEHYQENLQLGDLAEVAGVSANYLCRLFKKETGFTVVEYLNEVRIARSCELLRAEDLSAAELAQRAGFSDTAYFCSVFKKHTGRTVTEYRNQPR